MIYEGWDEVDEAVEQNAADSDLFIKLKSHGDKCLGVFCGKPVGREVVWTGSRTAAVESDDGKKAIANGERANVKVLINFYCLSFNDTDVNAMKVIEGGSRWWKDVKKLNKKYGFGKKLYEIERNGAAGDTKTTYSILPERDVDDDLRAAIKDTDLNDLKKIISGTSDDDDGDGEGAAGDSSTKAELISKEDAAEIHAQLKLLPKPDTRAFAAEFGIKRVSELRAYDLPRAKEFLAQTKAPVEEDELPF